MHKGTDTDSDSAFDSPPTAAAPEAAATPEPIVVRPSRLRRVLAARPALGAALLSFVLPGLGQLFMGRRRSAVVFIVPAIVAMGWIGLQLSQGLAWFGASIFNVTFAATLIGVVGFLGVWRVLAVGHAFLVGATPGRRRIWQTATLAVLVLSIVAVHGGAMALAWDGYQTGVGINGNTMLSNANLVDPSTDPTVLAATPTPDPTASPVDTSLFVPVSSQGPSAAPERTPTSNPDRITFLLVGVDFMTGRGHALTDTMMLATLDVHTNKATIVSVPRDTSNFDLYYGGWVGYNFKLNTLLSAAASSSFGSPDSAIETLKKEIGFLVGLPIDYYVAVDLEGFVKMVEALGGVDVDVKIAVNDAFSGTFVPKGMVHMDGHLALKYARSRESSSDYARAARQQDLLIALATKVASPEGVAKIPDMLSIAKTALATDFPLGISRNFITAFRRVKDPYKCVLGPPYSYHPDSSSTGGSWTSRLDMDLVAGLSVWLFGTESTYYGKPGVVPAPCGG